MQAVILAAGRGVRMAPLSDTVPKTLTPVLGVPIISRTIGNLPPEVDEVLIVVGYHADQVQAHVGDRAGNIPVRYVEQAEITGTAGSLAAASKLLSGRFLVLNGDDLYYSDDLTRLIKHPLAFGVKQAKNPDPRFWHVALDDVGALSRFERAPIAAGGVKNIATGAYVLDPEIFAYEPVRLSNGEYGLPQTIMVMARTRPVVGVFMDRWFSLTRPEDIPAAEEHIKRFSL